MSIKQQWKKWLSGSKKRPPTFYPRTLEFDSSGSAHARFVGQMADVSVHWSPAKVRHIKLICPDSVGLDDKIKCMVCQCHASPVTRAPVPRRICLCWDVRAQDWALYMAHAVVFREIMRKMRGAGMNASLVASGDGPDVLLTRVGNKTLAEVIPESMGTRPWEGEPPPLDAMLLGTQRRSYYVHVDDPGKIRRPSDVTGDEDDNNHDKKNGECIGGGCSEIMSDDEWDFVG